MHVINWNVTRPDPSVIEALRGYPTPILSDAMGRQGAMEPRMRPLFPGATLCGPAITVKTYPADNLMMHKALEMVRPGDVLVIDAGHDASAGWGELLSISAQTLGVRGVVLEGAARDRDAIAELGFPVFCTANVPRGTYKTNPGSINIPVCVGGIAVHPGDLIVGDSDGVVVIPRDLAAEVAAAARAVAAKEDALKEQLRQGRLMLDLLNLRPLLSRPDVKEIGPADPGGSGPT